MVIEADKEKYINVRKNGNAAKKAGSYGLCPTCKEVGAIRERRFNGNDICINNHVYPSKNAILIDEG